jgi:hypothetical protein
LLVQFVFLEVEEFDFLVDPVFCSGFQGVGALSIVSIDFDRDIVW